MNLGVITQTNDKGQLVVPKSYRDALGINPDIPLQILLKPDGFYVRMIENIITKNTGSDLYLQLLDNLPAPGRTTIGTIPQAKENQLKRRPQYPVKNMVVLDTSVIIAHLRQKTKDSLLRRLAVKYKNQMAISVVTLQELYEGQSTRDQIKENYMLSILTPLKILPYTEEVAKLAGILGRDNQTSADLADLAIAATAIVYKTRWRL